MNDLAAEFAQQKLDEVFRGEKVRSVYPHPDRPYIVVVETQKGIKLDIPGDAAKRLKAMLQ